MFPGLSAIDTSDCLVSLPTRILAHQLSAYRSGFAPWKEDFDAESLDLIDFVVEVYPLETLADKIPSKSFPFSTIPVL
jgi:hypothetical protein